MLPQPTIRLVPYDGGCPTGAADKGRQPLDACDTLLAKDAGMVTNRQSRRFPFDAAHRFTIEEYHRLVEEGILEERPRSVELLRGQNTAGEWV